jgi:hypothetical protein
MRRNVVLLAGVARIATACHAAMRSTLTSPLTPELTAELWHAPEGARQADVEREVPAGSLDRSRRLAHPLGRRLSSAPIYYVGRWNAEGAPDVANRFIRRFTQQIEEGLAPGR